MQRPARVEGFGISVYLYAIKHSLCRRLMLSGNANAGISGTIVAVDSDPDNGGYKLILPFDVGGMAVEGALILIQKQGKVL